MKTVAFSGFKRLCFLFIVLFALVGCGPITDREYLVPYLDRQYKLAKCDDKLDIIMTELGVCSAKRNAVRLARPVITLTENDKGEYTLATSVKVKNFSSTFKMGQEFEEVTPDGRKVRTTVYQEKNKLTQVQKGEQDTTVVHVFSLEQVLETVQYKDIVSYRIYTYCSSE